MGSERASCMCNCERSDPLTMKWSPKFLSVHVSVTPLHIWAYIMAAQRLWSVYGKNMECMARTSPCTSKTRSVCVVNEIEPLTMTRSTKSTCVSCVRPSVTLHIRPFHLLHTAQMGMPNAHYEVYMLSQQRSVSHLLCNRAQNVRLPVCQIGMDKCRLISHNHAQIWRYLWHGHVLMTFTDLLK